jgi:hypothetical protein
VTAVAEAFPEAFPQATVELWTTDEHRIGP